MRAIHFVIAPLLLLATQVSAQQLPQLDPAVQLGVCQLQRNTFLTDSEQAQTMMRQLIAERDDIKKRLAEAEAKASKADTP